MILVWIYVVVFMVPVTFAYNNISVNGNCSRTRPPEEFVVWGKPGQTLDCTLWKTNRCMGNIPQHLEGDHPAEPPSNLKVSGRLIGDPNGNSSPQIGIEWEWEGPGSGHLKGFILHIHTYNLQDKSLNTICRIFDFSGSTFNATYNKLKFQKKLIGFSGGSHLLHQLDLASLPRHSPDVRMTKFFTLQPVKSGTVIPASDWVPFISYDEVNFTAPATIEARFSLASPTYGFRQYTVMLVSKNDSLNAVERCNVSIDSSYFSHDTEFDPPSENETTALAYFSDVVAGEYVIHIQPLDPYRQDDTRCLCHSAANGLRQCQQCLDTHSAVFTVVANTDISKTTLPKTTTTTETVSDTHLPSSSAAHLTSSSTTSLSTLTTTQVANTDISMTTLPKTTTTTETVSDTHLPSSSAAHLTSSSTTSLSTLTTTQVSSTDYPNTETIPLPSSQVQAGASSGKLTVRGNCSRDEPPEPLAVWGKPVGCNGSLPPHLEVNNSASPPASLSVTGILIRDPQNESCPQIVITWSTANSDSRIANPKGFLLEIRKYDSANNDSTFVCRILDFSSKLFLSSDGELKFQKKLVGFPGGSHLLYQLALTSLPRQSSDVKLTKFFTLQPVQKEWPISASNWTPFISYDEVDFTAPATIEASFSLAPATYNFSQYTVMLVSKDDTLNAIAKCRVSLTSVYECQGRVLQPPSENDTAVLVSFSNISDGEYTLHIQSVDPYSMDDNKCLCYASVANGNRMCQGCLDTATTAFTVASSADATNTTIFPDGSDDEVVPVASIIGSVLGAAIGVMLVVILVALRINHYLKVRNGQRYLEQCQARNNNPGKRVILLSTEDHPYHEKVVGEFALFLHNSCGCCISYLPWEKGTLQEGDADAWVIDRMDESDFIIVINSRIAFETYEARSRDTTEHKVFNTAISHMHAKKSDAAYFQRFLFIHFAYTAEQFFIRDINPAAEYQMPEEVSHLLNHIHGMQIGEDAANNVRASLENMHDIIKLKELITKSTKFQKANPQWFVSEQIQEAVGGETGDNFCSVSQADGNALPRFDILDRHQTERLRVDQNYQSRYSQHYHAPVSEVNIEVGPNIDVIRDSSASNEPSETRDCPALRVDEVRSFLAPTDITSDIATSQLEKRLVVVNMSSLKHKDPTVDTSNSPECRAQPSLNDGGCMLPPSDVASDISTSQLQDNLAALTLGSFDHVDQTMDTSKLSEYGAMVSRGGGSSIVPPSDVPSDTDTSQLESGLAVHTLHSLRLKDLDLGPSTFPEYGAMVSRVGGSSIVPPSDVPSDTDTSQLESGLADHTLHSLRLKDLDLGPSIFPEYGAMVSRVGGSSIVPPSDIARDTDTNKLESGLADHTLHSLRLKDLDLGPSNFPEYGAMVSRGGGSSIVPPSDIARDTDTNKLESGLADHTLHSLRLKDLDLGPSNFPEYGAMVSRGGGSSIVPPSDIARDTDTNKLESGLADHTLHSLRLKDLDLGPSNFPEYGAMVSRGGGSSIVPPSDVASDTDTNKLESELADHTLHSLMLKDLDMGRSNFPEYGAMVSRGGGSSIVPPSDVPSDTDTSKLESGLAVHTLHSLRLKDLDLGPSNFPEYGAMVSRGGGSSIVPPSDVASDTDTSKLESGLAVHTLHSLRLKDLDLGPSNFPEYGAMVSRGGGSSIVPPSDVASDTDTSKLESGLAMHTLHSLGNTNLNLDSNMSASWDDGSIVVTPSDVAGDTATSKL